MYDELVKRLREYAKEHCPLDRGSGICGCIDAREAADAIEKLIKMPTPVRPFFLSYNCEENTSGQTAPTMTRSRIWGRTSHSVGCIDGQAIARAWGARSMSGRLSYRSRRRRKKHDNS